MAQRGARRPTRQRSGPAPARTVQRRTAVADPPRRSGRGHRGGGRRQPHSAGRAQARQSHRREHAAARGARRRDEEIPRQGQADLRLRPVLRPDRLFRGLAGRRYFNGPVRQRDARGAVGLPELLQGRASTSSASRSTCSASANTSRRSSRFAQRHVGGARAANREWLGDL
uniref:Uncharacterized protein n=1 Tax=Hyaloperonospora arabidopsidis (strain Emoy2) TaxID=559515 RepID=M4C705_HYAAE